MLYQEAIGFQFHIGPCHLSEVYEENFEECQTENPSILTEIATQEITNKK
jgi:hypothetical protein